MDQKDIDKFVAEFNKIGEDSSESPQQSLNQCGGGFYQENIEGEPEAYYTVLIKLLDGVIAAAVMKCYPDKRLEVVKPEDVDTEVVQRSLKWMGLTR